MGNNSSRTINTARNIVWGYIGTIISMAIQFVSRTIFIYTIGVSYLGINGLFTSVLGMLSLSELGIGTAINYNLYKPVANGDYEKIKSLMQLYKKAYRIIAIVITGIGLLLIPFLPHLINSEEHIPNITLYYVIFLFNTVSSYFVSYKYGLVNADQKGYIVNNINSIFTIFMTIIQIIVLLLFKNYIVYLVAQATIQLIQKFVASFYIDRRYPYLREKNVAALSKTETSGIKKNVIALMIHKIGEMSIHQTDSIIISAFISTTLVGMISNYNLIITSVNTFVLIIFNSVTASVGNLIAKESLEKQREIFDIYNFLGFWLYGVICICYYVLFQPFIQLWIGGQNKIGEISLALLILGQYLVGQRLTVNNMKTAAGIFEEDKYISLLQGMINLLISLILVRHLGLIGVYIGTVVSGMFANISRPIIVYREWFGTSAKEYFVKFIKYLSTVIIVAVSIKVAFIRLTSDEVSWPMFFALCIVCFVIPNIVFCIFYRNTREFRGMMERVTQLLQPKVLSAFHHIRKEK